MTWQRSLSIFAYCIFSSLWPAATGAETHHINTVEALQDRWTNAAPGDVIALANVDFGQVTLEGRSGTRNRPITLTSADAGAPAQFSGLVLTNAAHVVLENLVLDYTFAPGETLEARPFQLSNVEHVLLQGLVIDGDLARGLGPKSDGLPAGVGLTVRQAKGVTLRNSELRHFWRGLAMRESQDVRIARNHVHSLRMDGLTFAEVENVMIEDNLIRDFDRSVTSDDHADMIQFWTRHTKAPSRNVTIRNNIMNSETGFHTQTMFMGNGLVFTGEAGQEMYFRNFRIENNLIINAHKNGITLGAAIGVVIANNTLVYNPTSAGDRSSRELYRPQVSVSPKSRDVMVQNNIAFGFQLDGSQAGWNTGNNITIQDWARTKPYHYSMLFAGHDKAAPASFLPKPQGPLDGAGIGVNFSAFDWFEGL